MESAAVAEAARLFVHARRSGQKIDALPAHCRPLSAADVNQIVDAVTEDLVATHGERIGGWKIGFLYSPRQPPMICPLFESRLFASPAWVPPSVTSALRIEPEI